MWFVTKLFTGHKKWIGGILHSIFSFPSEGAVSHHGILPDIYRGIGLCAVYAFDTGNLLRQRQ